MTEQDEYCEKFKDQKKKSVENKIIMHFEPIHCGSLIIIFCNSKFQYRLSIPF